MTFRRWAVSILVAAVATVAAIYGLGLSMPERHLASVQRLVRLDVLATAARIRDVDTYPQWQAGITISDVTRDSAGIFYTETRDGRPIRYSLTETEPGRRFVARVVDGTSPFGGNWTIVLEPTDNGTQVLIVESGIIRNPFRRVAAAYVFGYAAHIDHFLDALAATGQAQV